MPLRFHATAVLALLGLLLLLPFYLAALAFGRPRAAMRVTVPWHRFALRLLGIRLRVTGKPSGARPLLLLANHISWLDIPVLGSILPVSFVAKQEVAGWPVVGWLAKLQRCVFIDRQRRHTAGGQANAIAARLGHREVIVLFAEGTSSDGNLVLPFRSALVGAAQRDLGGEQPLVAVQPVAIAYTSMLGIRLGRQHRSLVAWYGDADLLPHLRNILSAGGVDVQVVFGAEMPVHASQDRKIVAAEAARWARRVVAEVNSGREPLPPMDGGAGPSH